MICPKCRVSMHFEFEGQYTYRTDKPEEGAELQYGFCPECRALIVLLRSGTYRWVDDRGEIVTVTSEEVIYPKSVMHLVDPLIPDKYRVPFNEAYSVLNLSPKASAALSRRLLQSILWDEYNLKRRNLETEIAEFIQINGIPAEISESVDVVRNVGNFAAHPSKYQNTGEIVDVEPGEAEWLLEVLDALLDFRFVQPAKVLQRKTRLNSKLIAMGKPPLKN
jgi:hypothetical protein